MTSEDVVRRLERVETSITNLTDRLSSLEGELKLVKWFVGIIALTLISAATRYIVG